MAIDVEALLKPVSEDNPAGEDLSYDPRRQALEQAFERSESVDVTGAAAAAQDTDWRTIIRDIQAQFKESKDIWLAVYLCRAGAASGALETVEAGAQTLAGLFEQYWEPVHPTLEELGLEGRKAACDSLTTRGGFLGPLDKTILISHQRLGSYSGADFERFRQKAEAEDGYGMFRAALAEVGDEGLREALQRLQQIEDGFRRADKVFTTEAAGGPSTNFAPTYAALTTLQQAVRHFAPDPIEEAADEEAGEAELADGAAPAGGGGKSGGRISGSVDSREDVMRALDAVADYYRRREPSHPVQLLLERARAWVPMDFMTLLKDIAPGGVDQAVALLNKRDGVG